MIGILKIDDVGEANKADPSKLAGVLNFVPGARRAIAQSCTHYSLSGYPENVPPCHPSHRARPQDRETLRVMTHDAQASIEAAELLDRLEQLAMARRNADY